MSRNLCKTRGSAGTSRLRLVQCEHLVLRLCFPKTRKAELSYTELGQDLARSLVVEYLAKEARTLPGTFRGQPATPEDVPLNPLQQRMEAAPIPTSAHHC